MADFKLFEPNTKTPNPLPPPKSCDSQFHVFGPVDRYPIRPGAIYYTPEATIEAAMRMHRALGIERGIVVQSTAYGTDAAVLLDALAKAGPNYRGCAVIDETVSDAELQRLHDAGVRGARFNFYKRLNLVPTEASFKHSIARMQELGWYAKIHGYAEELVELEPLMRSLTLPTVIDHFGVHGFSEGLDQTGVPLIMELLKSGNWWMMLSNGDRRSTAGYPWDDAVPFARAYIDAAPDRMIWGTDWPHPLVTGTMQNDGDLLELAYRYATSEAMKRKILVENPAALFGFAP